MRVKTLSLCGKINRLPHPLQRAETLLLRLSQSKLHVRAGCFIQWNTILTFQDKLYLLMRQFFGERKLPIFIMSVFDDTYHNAGLNVLVPKMDHLAVPIY